MGFRLTAPPLEGSLVRLEPLEARHAADLAVAAEADRSTFGYTWVPRADEVPAYIATQRERAGEGTVAPYAQISRATGHAVGCTSFCTPRAWRSPRRLDAVEVGWTWLGRSAQGTGINTEAKLLLFRQAFEGWGVGRVDLMTDARNTRSRAAMERVGARPEGVLRGWGVSRVAGEEGRLRDTAVHAVLAADWTEVRETLEKILAERTTLAPPRRS
ncbi:GNAT family N-acetyltransferase [Streptomyces abyssomicinicus]|uniref:GNAT family N-acetyltransferase n=1 Tax=Streptomyces abyssomicinicus TaxID=574929 RepID=UPI00124F81C9|nr:GNAT family protein [Streptomyces abyssomicinicus]